MPFTAPRRRNLSQALPTKAQASLNRVQGQVLRAHPTIGLLRVKLPAQMSVSQAIDALYRSGAVEYAEPNALIIPQSDPPNDPQFVNQWSLYNDGSARDRGSGHQGPRGLGDHYRRQQYHRGSDRHGVDYLHEDF